MRLPGAMGLLLGATVLLLGACGGEEEDQGLAIPGTPMSFPKAEVHEGPMPEPTNTGNEPDIESYTFERHGPDRGVLLVEVSGGPLEFIYFEFRGVVYKIWPEALDRGHDGASDIVELMCESNLEANGVGCDPRCIEACGCATCDDRETEEALVGSCAVSCTNHLEHGLIPSESYDSIPDFVDKLYYGIPDYDLPGLLSQGQYVAAQCSGDAMCRVQDGGGGIRPATPFEFYIPDINIPCCAVAEDPPPRDRGTISAGNGLGTGTLNIGKRFSCSPPVN